jgi:hypothetical protein
VFTSAVVVFLPYFVYILQARQEEEPEGDSSEGKTVETRTCKFSGGYCNIVKHRKQTQNRISFAVYSKGMLFSSEMGTFQLVLDVTDVLRHVG